MAERISPSEKPKNEPFEIRGHHLSIYAEFLLSNEAPKEYAKNIRLSSEEERKNIRKLTYFSMDEALEAKLLGRLRYIDDVLGTKPKDALSYEIKYARALKTFKDLPNDQLVKLTEGKPDHFCRACTGKGAHCTTDDHEQFAGYDLTSDDTVFINEFLEASKDANTQSNLTIYSNKTNFPSINSSERRNVTIPSGDLKKTLQHIVQNQKNYAIFNHSLSND